MIGVLSGLRFFWAGRANMGPQVFANPFREGNESPKERLVVKQSQNRLQVICLE
jgi:hypothetical protein